MNIEEIREYCLTKKAVTEELPFGPETLVFKVMGKVFALTSFDSLESPINLKCDPERAIQLREDFSYIKPGYHMNKKHWNTVISGQAPNKQLMELIDHSYDLVVSGFTKKMKAELDALIEL